MLNFISNYLCVYAARDPEMENDEKLNERIQRKNQYKDKVKKFNEDNFYVKDNYNAVWVVSKSKIHIYRNPR